jgi:SAM-dependent methyltransferase
MEFDRLSERYHAGFDDPLKAVISETARSFLKPKVNLLVKVAGRYFQNESPSSLRMLDFGCGSADFLVEVREKGVNWRIEGCDVSQGMLAEAKRKHAGALEQVTLWNCSQCRLSSDAYTLITAVCVFHHIEPSRWLETACTIFGALKKGGLFLLFEHNPINPVTRWMVRRTEVDRNAVLLQPSTSRVLMEKAGFSNVSVEYFLFFPPRLKLLSACESVLCRVPLGGQYMMVGMKR